jgi:hypothetical protein
MMRGHVELTIGFGPVFVSRIGGRRVDAAAAGSREP